MIEVLDLVTYQGDTALVLLLSGAQAMVRLLHSNIHLVVPVRDLEPIYEGL